MAEKKVRRQAGALAQLKLLAKLCEVGSLVLEAVGKGNRVSNVAVFEALEHVDGGVVLRAEGKLPEGAKELRVVRQKGITSSKVLKRQEVLLRSALKPDATAVVAVMRVKLTANTAVTTH